MKVSVFLVGSMKCSLAFVYCMGVCLINHWAAGLKKCFQYCHWLGIVIVASIRKGLKSLSSDRMRTRIKRSSEFSI